MGDIYVAQELLDTVQEVIADHGWEMTLRRKTYSAIDENDPGAAPTESIFDTLFDGFSYEIESKYVNGTSVLEGDKVLLMDLTDLTTEEIDGISPGNFILDGSESYNIIKSRVYKSNGTPLTVMAQLRS